VLWLIGLALLSCFLALFLLGRREERAMLRGLELLLARRKASGEAADSSPSVGSVGANLTFRTAMLWMALLVVIFLAWHFAQVQKRQTSKKFTEFVTMVEAGEVADVFIDGNEIRGHTVGHEAFRSFAPPTGYDKLVDCLLARKVMVTYPPDEARGWVNRLAPWAPFVLLAAFGVPFTWHTLTRPVVRERWRLKRKGYRALLKALTELRSHLGEVEGLDQDKRRWSKADRVDVLTARIASELAVAQVWLRPHLVLSLATVDDAVRGLAKSAAPQPEACRHAIKAIDEALELLAEAFREEFGLGL